MAVSDNDFHQLSRFPGENSAIDTRAASAIKANANNSIVFKFDLVEIDSRKQEQVTISDFQCLEGVLSFAQGHKTVFTYPSRWFYMKE